MNQAGRQRPGRQRSGKEGDRRWLKGKRCLSAALSVEMWKGTAQRRRGTAGGRMKKGIFPLLPFVYFINTIIMCMINIIDIEQDYYS